MLLWADTVGRHRDFPDVAYGPLEIAAVSCAPFDTTKNFASTIAVSFWGTNCVALLSLASAESYLTSLCEVSLPSLPRSLLLHNFGTGRNKKEPDFCPHLLVGLGDGSVVSYVFKEKERGLGDNKVFSLGTAPVSFSTCIIEGRRAVFASGSRASVLYWDRQRLHQSPVMIKVSNCSTARRAPQGLRVGQDPVVAASLNTSAFPSCLVLATSSSVLIGNVRGADKMQIKTVGIFIPVDARS